MSAGTIDRDLAIPDDLLKAALSLPEAARANFASTLLKSLDDSEDDPEVVRAEWRNELARRIEDIRSGKVQPVDGHSSLVKTRQRLREKYGV
jgi:Putative addiction module component